MNDENRVCPHCPWMEANGIHHAVVCKCSHHHADHTAGGGCKLCQCDRYDQSWVARESEQEVATVVQTTIDVAKLQEQATTTQVGSLSAVLHRVDKLRAKAAAKKAEAKIDGAV